MARQNLDSRGRRRARGVSRSERELVDALVDAYADWREEAAAVEGAYRRWRYVENRDKALAFTAYVTALDREEYAANRYAATIADFRWARR